MSIRITVEEALLANSVCGKLLTKAFPIKTSFKLAQLIKELSAIEQIFFEAKNKAILKYAKRNEMDEIIMDETEDGQSFIPLAPEHMESCAKELNDTLKETVEISKIQFFIEEFGDELLSPEDLLGIYPFITE